MNSKRIFLFLLMVLLTRLAMTQTCNIGTRTCPTVNPVSSVFVCQNSPLTINSNVSGSCSRPQCCYDAATSNLSINVAGNHTYVSDLRYWVLNGTGPQGNKSIVLYNAGGVAGTIDPVTSNNYTGNCNSGNNFNLSFSYSVGSVMPSICSIGTPLSGTYRPETVESELNGIDIASYSWSMQVFDCVGADVGDVTSVTLTLTNPDCNNDCIGCGGSASAGTKTFTFGGSAVIADNSCSSGTAATVNFSPIIVPPVQTVVWNGPGAVNVVGNTFSPSTSTAGTFVYTVKPQCDGAECTGCTATVCDAPVSPATVTVNVLPIPTVNAVANMIYCPSNLVPTITFSGTPSGVVFNWSRTGTNLGLAATSGTGSIPSFTASNAGTTVLSNTFTVTPTYTSGGVTCTGTPTNFTISVNPNPTVNSVSNQTFCEGSSSTAVTFMGTPSGSVYNWSRTPEAIGLGTTNGTGNISTFIGTNATTAPLTSNFTVTPTFTSGGVTCTGSPTNFNMTVNPTPDVNAVANITSCPNEVVGTIVFSGSIPGTIFNWTRTAGAIGLGATSGIGNIPTFTTTNPSPNPISSTFTVTPQFTSNGVTCTGTPINFTITINGTPTINAVPNVNFCTGTNTTIINFTGNNAGNVYTWTRTSESIGLATTSGVGPIPSFIATNAGTIPLTSTFTVTPMFTSGGVTCSGAPIMFNITINPNPQPNISGILNVCPGFVVDYDGLPSGGSGVYTLHNWSITNGGGTGITTGNLSNTNQQVMTLDATGLVAGTITLMYTVTDNNGCTGSQNIDINITDDCNYGIQIQDPCVCNDDADVNSDNGTFMELVTISFAGGASLPPGQIWTISEIYGGYNPSPSNEETVPGPQGASITAGTTFTYCGTPGGCTVYNSAQGTSLNAPFGSYYLVLTHIDNEGFSVQVEGPGPVGGLSNVFLGITNTCFYPEPTILNLPAQICVNSTPITLQGSPNGTGIPTFNGDATFVGGNPPYTYTALPGLIDNGNGTSTFDPAIAGVGVHTISYTFKDNNSPGTSEPGCYSVVEATIEVIGLPNVNANWTGGTYCPNSPIINLNSLVTGTTGGIFSGAGVAGTYPNYTFNPSSVGVGVYAITYTLNSGSPCSVVSQTNNIIIGDIVAPTFTCPPTQNLNLDGNCQAMVPDLVALVTNEADNCTTTPIVTQAIPLGTILNNTITVDISVYDEAGNFSTCEVLLNVIDNVNPTAICKPYSVELDATGTAHINIGNVNSGSYDNCGVSTISAAPLDFTCANLGSNTVILTILDDAGNSATCSSMVTVSDALPPAIICPSNVTVSTNSSCMATIPNLVALTSATDNCGTITITQSPLAGTIISSFDPVVVTLTAMDGSGNFSTCTVEVTMVDNVAPLAVCQNFTTALDVNGMVTIAPNQINNISSDNCSITNMTLNKTSFNCGDVGSNSVTLTVTDAAGNTNTCLSNVTIDDNILPTIICPVAPSINFNGNCNVLLPNYAAAADISDNCGILNVTQTPIPGTTITANQLVTLTVEDINGNTTSCSFTVTLIDSEMPTAICKNLTVELDNTGVANITTADIDGGSYDNCTPDAMLSLSLSDFTFDCNDLKTGPVSITLTVIGSGGMDQCEALITVIDQNAPEVISCTPDLTVNTGVDATMCGAIATWIPPSFDDNCTFNVFSTHDPGDIFLYGQTQVTYTAFDVSGNSTSCSFNVNVIDNTVPTIICPIDQTINLNSYCEILLPNYTAAATVDDHCGIAFVTQNPPPGFQIISPTTTIVTLTVTDDNGNTNTCTFEVTTEDAVAPTLYCPSDITLSANGSCTAVGTFAAAVTDGCDNSVSLTYNPSSGSTFAIGSTPVTVTAEDASGNISVCTFNVHVVDNTPPTFVCPATQVLSASSNCTATVPNLISLVTGVLDNCTASPLITQSIPVGTQINSDIVVNIKVFDASGNYSECNVLLQPALCIRITKCSIYSLNFGKQTVHPGPSFYW